MTAKFDGKVRKIVAMRAGYRCSFPDCGRLTIGPGAGASDYLTTGSASHIYGASEQGPRGAGGHSYAERSSIENAIWLCAQHSRVVDANEGEGFPPALLRSFKEEHEARVAAEHAGRRYYWIAGLEVGRNPVFCANERIRLTKVTLIVGENGTGKTTILRWLDQIGDSSRREDAPQQGKTEPIEYAVEVFTPARRIVRVRRDSQHLQFNLDGESVLFNPISMHIIFPERFRYLGMLEGFLKRRRERAREEFEEIPDDVALLAEYMDVNPLVIPSLLPFVGRFVPGSFVNLRIVGEDGKRHIHGDDLKRKKGISIHEASGSMLSRAVLDMQIAMATLSAKTGPTILLLDLPVLHLDPNNLFLYVSFFLSQAAEFQVVFTSPEVSLATSSASLGWSIVKLSGRAPFCKAEALSW